MNFSDHGHARTKHLGVEFCFQSRSCAVCSAESPTVLPPKQQKAHVLGNQHCCLQPLENPAAAVPNPPNAIGHHWHNQLGDKGEPRCLHEERHQGRSHGQQERSRKLQSRDIISFAWGICRKAWLLAQTSCGAVLSLPSLPARVRSSGSSPAPSAPRSTDHSDKHRESSIS